MLGRTQLQLNTINCQKNDEKLYHRNKGMGIEYSVHPQKFVFVYCSAISDFFGIACTEVE